MLLLLLAAAAHVYFLHPLFPRPALRAPPRSLPLPPPPLPQLRTKADILALQPGGTAFAGHEGTVSEAKNWSPALLA